MARYLLGLTLQDRPGALGSVASAIGALGGDLVDIEVLERSRGVAKDEITVDLSHEDLAVLMTARLAEIDGVSVDHVSAVDSEGQHLLVDALEVAGALVAEREVSGLLDALVTGMVAAFSGSWAAVLAGERGRIAAQAGSVLPASLVRGASAPGDDLEDQVRMELRPHGAVLAVGREGWAFRARERRDMQTLAAIASARWSELDPLSQNADS